MLHLCLGLAETQINIIINFLSEYTDNIAEILIKLINSSNFEKSKINSVLNNMYAF